MADESHLFLFEFRGRAETRTKETPEEPEITFFLNDQSEIIEREIQQEIRRALPLGVNIETQIRFYEGSIAWEGIVVILDWMARLAGAAEFVSILSKIVKAAVERVLQRWLGRRNQLPFPVRVVGPIQVEVTFQTASGYPSQSTGRQSPTVSIPRILAWLTAINTLLLLAVLIMQLVFR
jgi:hypothetical protein